MPSFKEVHSRNCSFKNKFQNSASKCDKLDSRYSQVYLLTLCYHWKIVGKSFIRNVKDHYLSLQYFTNFDSSLSFKLMF